MKIASLLLLGFFSINLISCVVEPTDDDPIDPVENNDKDSTKTSETKPSEPKDKVLPNEISYGIDISKYQGDEMELMTKAADSLSFVICRATEGITFVDADFKRNWSEIKEKGFIRGAYHFYRSNDDPTAQAKNFIRMIKDLDDSDLPPIIDFEGQSIAKGADTEQVIEDLWKFIFLIQEKTGRHPIIYTNENIGNKYLTATRFANYTLWIADYSSSQTPKMPLSWKGMDWVMWQKSDTYRFDRITSDFDVFNGSRADLKKMIEKSILK